MRCVGIGDSDLGRRAARDAFPRGTWEREKPGKEGSREYAKTRRRAKNAIYAFALLVLDEVETLQRMRGDVRDKKSLNALRQIMDEVDSGRFPGLYVVITGTPPFFHGPMGVQRLPPLVQRLAVDFTTDARFDNRRAVQLRLKGFDAASLCEVGCKVRDLYAAGSDSSRLAQVVDDAYVEALALAVTGNLGGKVGVAPRIFLKKLVGEVLDRVDQFDDFDPRRHYALTISDNEPPVSNA